MFKNYYLLTKPGIVYGNAIPAIAGFFLASKGHINFLLFFSTLAGLSLIIASSCVCNNYIDRGIDAKMERTKKRALVTKSISVKHAMTLASMLGLAGFLLLLFNTNRITTSVALGGVFFYIVLYSIWKRRSIYGTIVGSISGAVPPIVGYTAVSNHIDAGAMILFLILVVWQMPHFYAISLYRSDDYTAASIPVLPVKKGVFMTKIHMLLYIIAFTIMALMLTVFHYTGYVYGIGMVLLSVAWFGLALKGFKTTNTIRWAKHMFLFSLIILVAACLMMSIDVVV